MGWLLCELRPWLADSIRHLLGFHRRRHGGGLVLYHVCWAEADRYTRMPDRPLLRMERGRVWNMQYDLRMGHTKPSCHVPGFDCRRCCGKY
jgi:hypothetical protein